MYDGYIPIVLQDAKFITNDFVPGGINCCRLKYRQRPSPECAYAPRFDGYIS